MKRIKYFEELNASTYISAADKLRTRSRGKGINGTDEHPDFDKADRLEDHGTPTVSKIRLRDGSHLDTFTSGEFPNRVPTEMSIDNINWTGVKRNLRSSFTSTVSYMISSDSKLSPKNNYIRFDRSGMRTVKIKVVGFDGLVDDKVIDDVKDEFYRLLKEFTWQSGKPGKYNTVENWIIEKR